MRDRIKQIMDYENLTPSIFADKLDIGRAVISHILSGRNKPSLDVVTRILETMDYINSDWLLSGKGNMLREESDGLVGSISAVTPVNKDTSVDLFTTVDESDNTVHTNVLPIVNSTAEQARMGIPEPKHTEIETKIPIISTTSKKASKIIIYYTDNTFESFNPDPSPL